MEKIINYEKDIIFKTNIAELVSISLEHDFTLDDGVLRGDFLVSGEYKSNELSVNKEKFEYRLPLEYELEDTVDLDTLNYDIDNFEYTTRDDVLSVYIDFKVHYDEIERKPEIPIITEEELNAVNLPDFHKEEEKREEVVETPSEGEEEMKVIDEEETKEESRLDDDDENTIIESLDESDEYITYHVHIVRDGDTLESISEKYNCSIDLIKEYNDFDALEDKMKLLIPENYE